MTFDVIESSTDDGSAVELYLFKIGSGFWSYTNHDEDITFQGKVYKATVMSRDAINSSTEAGKQDLTITISRSTEIAQIFESFPPNAICELTIFRQHYLDPDNEFKVLWPGRIVQSTFMETELEFVSENQFTAMRRNGLRRPYSLNCPHALYDANTCRVLPEDYKVDGVVASINGLVIEVTAASGEADDYFAGGKIEWFDSVLTLTERRMIVEHTGSDLSVDYSTYRLQVGQAVQIFPGCDHTINTCDTKFDNSENHGGCPYIPHNTPFETPVV